MQARSKKSLSIIIVIYFLNIIMLESSFVVDNNTQDKSSLDIQQLIIKFINL